MSTLAGLLSFGLTAAVVIGLRLAGARLLARHWDRGSRSDGQARHPAARPTQAESTRHR